MIGKTVSEGTQYEVPANLREQSVCQSKKNSSCEFFSLTIIIQDQLKEGMILQIRIEKLLIVSKIIFGKQRGQAAFGTAPLFMGYYVFLALLGLPPQLLQPKFNQEIDDTNKK